MPNLYFCSFAFQPTKCLRNGTFARTMLIADPEGNTIEFAAGRPQK